MEFSPIRSKLMSFENTPAKNFVNCEINGWMETNMKKNRQLIRPKSFGKPYQKKVIPKKYLKENSNLASLKQRKLQLLDSNRKEPSLKQISKTQKVTTAQINSNPKENFQVCFTQRPQEKNSSQTITDFKLKLNEISVSEFKEHPQETNSKKTIFRQSNQNIPPLLRKSMPRGRTQRIVPRPPQNTNELFEKLKNHQANIMEKRNNKNVISINPEMKNLIIKSKKVLSVSYFPLG